MLDIKILMEGDRKYLEGIKKKGGDITLIDGIISDYKELNELSAKLNEKRALQNSIGKNIASYTGIEKQKAMDEMKEVKSYVKNNEQNEKDLKEKVRIALCNLPNSAHESVIPGKSDEENKVIRYEGQKPKLDFEAKPHWILGEELDLIDSERGAKVAGSRFHFLKNELVLMQFALVQYAFGVVGKYGFKPLLPPYMVNKEAAFGTGFLDSGHEDEVYAVNPGLDDFYLIGTSEVPNTAYYANEIIPESQLPIRVSAYSPCFRREAGSYGKDAKGILRCHQFDKIEMGVFADPLKSWDEHELILKIEEEIYKGLGLHYQLIDICAGDLGGPAAKKYDIEAWMPGMGQYREVTSTSNCTDFQARRLNIRVKRENGKNEILHTLNGTAIAVGRCLIAIMENYQTKEGEILVPEVLKKWLDFDRIKKK